MTLADTFNPEVLVILLVIVLVMIGGKKIPDLLKGIGNNRGGPRPPAVVTNDISEHF